MHFIFLGLFNREVDTMIFGFLIFLFMNFIVVFNSYLILKNFKVDTPEDKLLVAGVLAISQIILILLSLGLMKILYIGTVIISLLLVTISIFFILSKKRRISITTLISDFKMSKRFISDKIKYLKKTGIEMRLSFLFLIFTISIIVFSGIITPPYSHDGLLYHLPMAVSWLKAGTVYIVELTTFGDINMSMYYPGNAELILLWNIFPFYDDFIVDLSQLIFAILGAIACYGIARKIKIKKQNALWAPILFLLSPIIILQSKTTYNDIIFASMFLVSINFLLSYKKSNKKSDIVLSALSFGITLGTKYLGITYFLIYILFFGLIYPKKRLSNKIALDILTVILFIFLLGGYWYLRNFLETGSVIYPMRVRVFNYMIMPGPQSMMTMYRWSESKYVSNNLEWLIYPFLDGHKTYREYTYESGFGPQFISLMIPSIIFLFFLFFFAKNKEIFFSLFPLLVLLFFLTPTKEPRYYISLLGIGSVAVSYCISKINYSRIIKIIAVLCIIFSVYYSLPTLFPCNGNILKVQNKYDSWLCTYPSYAEGWKWLNDHTGGDNIIGITHFLYPLYGDKLKNNIIFIPSGDIYIPSEYYEGWSEFYRNWLEGLKEYEINYLFMAPYQDYEYNIREYDFIKKLDPKLVYEKESVSIYSIENLWD